ncbi:outer membrane protein assembly factor BamB [Streptomyces sp. V4I23]|uniref:serine/threonine-protein kinase n=1 Tax=Streptomyces sp. V4I23 TaxID=3042282 RepID=UPI00277FF286|nr:serine/threonine-protein kinase [Streptomyces sp. V4I23]MDQ1010499.1 outer membrane protein assembly factor BamB [Streptomyces sp. V4I23]
MRTLGTGDPLRLGPYRLHGVLGEGGMGKVYIGQDSSGTTAAVKVLRPELAYDQSLAQRFVREAQMARAVTSRGVARVLGAQTEGGRPWIATEFLAGPTLDQAIGAHGPLDEPSARVLAFALARTLADIHAAGMIHRDLKPSNIILASSGPRIIDFGIARPEHGLTLTTTGQVPATPGYGAPEQVLGQRVGPPADVFSLGAVLVYAITGEQAFTGTHIAAVQYEVVHGMARLERVPPQLAPLIGPCLAKDPAHRPTPAQMAGAFAPPRGAERVWRHGPLAADIKQRERSVHQLTTAISPSGSKGTTRRRLVTGLAVGGAVVAAGGGTAAAWWLGRDRDPFTVPPPADTPLAEAGTATTGKPAPLWGPDRLLAGKSPDVLPVRDVLVLSAAGGGIAAHSVVDGEQRWKAPAVSPEAGFLSLSDSLVAAVDEGGNVVTFVAATGEKRWTVKAAAKCLIAADDSAVYAVMADGRLRCISRSNGKILWTVQPQADLLTKKPPFGATSRPPTGAAARGRLVVATASGRVLGIDVANGRQVWGIDDQASVDFALIEPVILGDTVFINGGSLTARNLGDGAELWAKSELVEGKLQPSGPPLVHGKTVYTTQGPYILGFDAADGNEAWRSPEAYFMYSPVVVQANTVCAINSRAEGDDVEVWAMSRDDRKGAWRHLLPKDAGSYGLVGSGNRIFAVAGEELVALPVFG